MKLLLLSVFVWLALPAGAMPIKGLQIPYYRVSSEVDSTLPEFESILEFKFSGIADSNFTIIYSVDGKNAQAKLTPESRLTICVKPGKHIFQFFSWHYIEIFTDSIEISPQHRDLYQVNMSYTYSTKKVAKPVLYFYPEEPTLINAQIDIHGENPFYYPAYDGSWQFTALPDGEIQMNDQKYNYLFWEADAPATSLLHREGSIVPKNGVVKFLEKQLSAAGFTSKEQADFITFWAPQLMQNEHNFVQFIFNDACDEYAELKISPKPDNIYRIYMLWQPSDIMFEVREQIIEPINREGFTVLEWGGMEIPAISSTKPL